MTSNVFGKDCVNKFQRWSIFFRAMFCCLTIEKKRTAASLVEADWSKLPKDLLSLISERLGNELDLTRFRSVCSSWHSSVSNHHRILPFKLPLHTYPQPNKIYSNIKTSSSSCFLSKHSFFLIKPPPQQEQTHHPWLIRITQNSRGQTKLFPLCTRDSTPPYHFPYVIDFNQFSIIHLGTDFLADNNEEHLPCPKKIVAATRHGKKTVLGTLNYLGYPVFLRCGDEHWMLISDDMSMNFKDICVFKDQFCAVNKFGRTVAIGPEDSSVELVAERLVDGGNMKFLVESEGELLLVDIYDIFGFRLDVFRLDEKEKKWVKLTSLEDRVLFLGNGCSFSASASDLSIAEGNCVIIVDETFLPSGRGMCLFHLDGGSISPLSDHPHHLNLFWPPPEWIIKMLQHS
jgi:hypothetical protein